jgi:hypothetical protein
MSPSIGGCAGSRRCWPTRRDSLVIRQATGGSSTRRTSRSTPCGGTCYRAIDQHGQVIDALVSTRRDAYAARRFFRRALATLRVTPSEVVTDKAAVYPGVLDELIPSARHRVEQHANNPIEADHGQLKHRLRPTRGLRTDTTAQIIIAAHAFIQNLRRGHYELAVTIPPGRRVAAAFAELVQAI